MIMFVLPFLLSYEMQLKSIVITPDQKIPRVQKQICSNIHMNNIHLCKEMLLVESPLGAESSRMLSLEVRC